jgi:hypothetical protein
MKFLDEDRDSTRTVELQVYVFWLVIRYSEKTGSDFDNFILSPLLCVPYI